MELVKNEPLFNIHIANETRDRVMATSDRKKVDTALACKNPSMFVQYAPAGIADFEARRAAGLV